MSNPLTPSQVRAKLKEISEVQKSDPDVVAKTDADIIAINALTKEIEDGGWHLQAKAYRKEFTSVKGRRYNKWRVAVAYVNGNKSVKYYDGPADSKRVALETQARYPWYP